MHNFRQMTTIFCQYERIKIHANFFATTLDIVEVIYRFFTLATVMHFDFVSAQILVLVDDWGLL